MKYLILLIMFPLTSSTYLIDFGGEPTKDTGRWFVISDGVMGGLSEGDARFTDSGLEFVGNISFENNGGFTSLRDEFRERDLSGYKKVKIRYKLDGQVLGFTLETSKRWFMPNYKVMLEDTQGEWETVTFKLKDFDTYQIGRKKNSKITERALSQILRIGFITSQKKEGYFTSEIDYIEFE